MDSKEKMPINHISNSLGGGGKRGMGFRGIGIFDEKGSMAVKKEGRAGRRRRNEVGKKMTSG